MMSPLAPIVGLGHDLNSKYSISVHQAFRSPLLLTSTPQKVDYKGNVVIRTVDVEKIYRLPGGETFKALDLVNIDVEKGELLALTGPSGCGKSTLLRMIASLEAPTRGSVTINGRSPAEVARQHRIGIAFQDHALLPWLTVRQNVELPFHIAGAPVNGAKTAELLALVGLADFAGARPKQLSGGMRQRAAIARALVLDPDILLLDEPFAALDAVTRRTLNLELQRILSYRPVTTVLVTHSMEEAVFLADRVIVLSGRPGAVKLVRDIPFERPRDRSCLTTPAFHRAADALAAALDVEEPRP